MKALTANSLRDGYVVYWDGAGWTRDIAAAALLNDADADAALAAALRAETVVVGPYLLAMRAPGEVDPRVRSRETIRAYGPTVGVEPS